MNSTGLIITILSFLCWGFVPLYWKMLKAVPAFEIVNHRILWTALISLLYLVIRKKTPELIATFKNKRKFLSLLVSTLCITSNWGIFIWAVNENRILETSLGYYINPLINVLFGATILKEKFSKPQMLAIISAFTGVVIMTFFHEGFPWIALSLSVTFALYGLIRKVIPVSSDVGLTAEAAMLFVPALIYLGFINENSHFIQTPSTAMLLIGAGFVSTIPLLLYLEGVRRIPYSTVGILQFLTPTTTFFLAVFVYNEPFDQKQFISFSFIWLAVAIYIIDIAKKRMSK